MAHVAFFKGTNATKGLYFSMTTDMTDPAAPTVPHRANDRIQLSMTPIELTKDATTGVIGPDSTEGQPVGTIWIGIACEDEHPVANRINIEHHDPATIRALAASDAMQLLTHHMNHTRQ